MKSHEVIRSAVEEPGVKAVAAALKLSPALVYKWCEPTSDDGESEQSGAKNPLDRTRELYAITKDIRIVRFLCNEAGGFFVVNPQPEVRKDLKQRLFGETQGIVRDFSALLGEITAALENDNNIDSSEADAIRQHWEELKSMVERFVIASERGHFRDKT
jgi:hypothetical protein